MEEISKNSFVVIGKEGSTEEGDGFIQKLWQEANTHFDEIAGLAKRDESGNLLGIWGAMTDFSRSFKPWDDFNRGLYLAGAECKDEAEAPEGWVKWVLPASDYLRVECEGDNTFFGHVGIYEREQYPACRRCGQPGADRTDALALDGG